jgi:hypothetical protein
MFGKSELLSSSDEERETSTLVVALEKANLTHWKVRVITRRNNGHVRLYKPILKRILTYGLQLWDNALT